MDGILLSLRDYIDKLCLDTSLTKDQAFEGLKEKKSFGAYEAQMIADNLGVHLFHLLNNSIDYDFLENAHNDQSLKLPKIFMQGTYSSTTSLKSVLNEFRYYDKYEDALKYLQIQPEVLEEHRKISILGIYDVIRYMRRYLSDEHLQGIGFRNADSFLKTDFFGNEFYEGLGSNHPTLALLENIHLIERNWNYNISKAQRNRIVINTSQTQEMLDVCKDQSYTDEATVKIRFSFIKRVINQCGLECELNQMSDIGPRGEFKFELVYKDLKQRAHESHLSLLQ